METQLQYLAIGLMSVGMFGAAFAIGNIFSALLNGVARNPEAEEKLSKHAYVGAGLAESIGIFCLVIALILIFS
jgi:F-type H+-transporting ATPase subunit c